MKLISWNVNGLQGLCDKRDFWKAFAALDADVFCIQESKLQEGQIDLDLPGYHHVLELCGEKGLFRYGYVYQDRNRLSVTYGIGSRDSMTMRVA